MKPEDYLVQAYQQTGECSELLSNYHNFIGKYYNMFKTGQIDFKNYDIRRFLACFIPEKDMVQNLCRGKFHSRETIYKAQQVLRNISIAFDDYDPQEIYNELVIIFLECAKDYKEIGAGFSHYIYHVYRYRLKKYIDIKMYDCHDANTGEYRDIYCTIDDRQLDSILELKYYDNPLNLEVDEHTDLNNLLWLNGVSCGELFKDLTYNERYILVKAYEDGMDDKEIARLNGFHHRSIYRIRKRIIEHFREKRIRGEIKCIR